LPTARLQAIRELTERVRLKWIRNVCDHDTDNVRAVHDE
jgi:hypothetical protein